MNIRRTVLVTAFVFLILTSMRLTWIAMDTPTEHPDVVRGELDLRNWNFTNDPIITLDGQWEFYPNQFVMFNEGPILTSEREYIQVPSKWNAFFPEEQYSAHGYGSYRLRLSMQQGIEQSYSIRLSKLQTSSEVFVNGKSIGRSGQPAPSADQHVPRNVPYTVTFTSDEQEIELVIHVANYLNSITGGVHQSIQFGTTEAINHDSWFSISSQIVVAGFLFIQIVYACLMFIIGSRQRSLLYFSTLVLSMIIMLVLDDDKVLLLWLPIQYEWSIRLVILSYIGIGTSLLVVIRSIVPEFSKFRYFNWFLLLSAIFALIITIIPAQLVWSFGIKYYYLLLFILLTVIVLTLRSTIKGGQDVIYLFLALSIILGNGIWGILKGRVFLDMGYYPIDMMVAFFIFSAFWFKQYFRVSAQTKKLADKLQEADRQKDEFLANTSHELRNPLHGILNIAQNVLDTGKSSLSDKNVKNMELLVTVGRRMSFMLNDLLDLMRLKEKGIRLQTKSLSIQTIAAGACDMLYFMTEGKPIRIINAIPDTFPRILADENRLLQILFNLLHNAVKYTNEGSITIEAHVQDNKAKIMITDTGIGIDVETQEKIFQPYEQVDSGITSVGGGFGLGLHISKQLVELHGGVLEVTSSLGQGTAFSFSLSLSDPSLSYDEEEKEVVDMIRFNELPVAAAADTVDPTDHSSASVVTHVDRPRVLVVDDDSTNLTILVNMLSLERYEMVTATSGSEALALLDKNEWDLIIADVMMPHMSGYELSRTIRERFSISELPILLLTARSQPEDIEAGFRSGANDYVTKPVEAMELRSRVRILTELRKSIRERLRMEAAWLQAQIQPHFLFNTLNAIAALSDFDSIRMRTLLDEFGKYLRASFDFRNSERVVQLEHELGLVRSYLFIEQERFEDRLKVHWEIAETRIPGIPPLSIQPLVENAVRHGIMKKSQGGIVHIRIIDKNTYVEISIEDNGVGMNEDIVRDLLVSKPGRSSGIGLLNIDRRLKQIYGQGLLIRSVPDQGTIVSFVVPK